MSVKIFIKNITPHFALSIFRDLKIFLRLLPNMNYDMWRYFVYSGINKSRNCPGNQAARITMAYHQLEKGLSLSRPRPGFGNQVLERLLDELGPFISKYGLVQPATNSIAALNSYIKYNEESGLDMSDLRNRISALLKLKRVTVESCNEGGIIHINLSQIEEARNSGFDKFFNSRYSVRHFTGLPIQFADIEKAVKIAQKTPSVCNRQAWKSHVYLDSEMISQLLSLQNGSRGFGDQASALLVITCDLTRFVNVAERYQAWIDGGMFSMSLCLSFHYLGFGTCCLNWSKEKKDDIKLRSVAGIPHEEQVIMMIAVGTLPDSFNVAYSPRRPIEDILINHCIN